MTQSNEPKQLQCDRCRTFLSVSETEKLTFKSQYKTSDLILCKPCFQSCRELFIKWIEGKA